MKRLSLLGFVGLLASVLAGCPIYDGDWQCQEGFESDCSHRGPKCEHSAQCQQNETCGTDFQCHSGDCTNWGCTTGFACVVDQNTQTASCVSGNVSTTSSGTGGTGDGGSSAGGSSSGGSSTGGSSTGGASTGGASTGGAATGGAGTGGSAAVYCGNPADCASAETCAPNGTCTSGDCTVVGCIYGFTCASDGACKSSNPASCTVDSECASGLACVSGVCTQGSDQCVFNVECPISDECVAGKCTVSCASDADCRDGFGCDTTTAVCSKPLKSCQITSDCGGPSTVCVAAVCVPRSMGPTCPPGDVWVANGCIPNQSPIP